MDLVEKIVKVYNEPCKKEFDYNIEQTIRILNKLSSDTFYIQELLGQNGKVIDRYTTGISKENKYEIKFENGRIETFDEDELDKRYMKRVNANGV